MNICFDVFKIVVSIIKDKQSLSRLAQTNKKFYELILPILHVKFLKQVLSKVWTNNENQRLNVI